MNLLNDPNFLFIAAVVCLSISIVASTVELIRQRRRKRG